MTEVEWKFLASFKRMPDKCMKYMHIKQGYIIAAKRFEWRLRCTEQFVPSSTDDYWHTALKIGNGFVRREYEFQIPKWMGKALSRFVPRFLYKTRISDGTWDVDLFHGALRGMVLAETEVKTADTPMPPAPDWLTLELDLTGDPHFANKALSRLPLAVQVSLAHHCDTFKRKAVA